MFIVLLHYLLSVNIHYSHFIFVNFPFLQLHDLPSHEMKCPYESCSTSFTRYLYYLGIIHKLQVASCESKLSCKFTMHFFHSLDSFTKYFMSTYQEQQHVPTLESCPRRRQPLHLCLQELLGQVIDQKL